MKWFLKWFGLRKLQEMIIFYYQIKAGSNTIYVFDKGYNDYQAFKLFSDNNVGFVTRIKDNAFIQLQKNH
jgi:hypothetical protein